MKLSRICVKSLFLSFCLVIGVQPANAHRSPPNCGGAGVGVQVFKFRENGTVANTITNGEKVIYAIQVQNDSQLGTPGGQVPLCDVTCANVTFRCPDATGSPGALIVVASGINLPFPTPPVVVGFVTCTVAVASEVVVARARAEVLGVVHDVSIPGCTPNATCVTNTCDPDTGGGLQEASVTVRRPCISVVKQCVSATNATGNAVVVTFTGYVTNCGDETLASVGVTNNQPVPGTLVTNISSLAPGQAVTFNGSYTNTSNLCGPFTDTVTATGTGLSSLGVVTASSSATCTITYGPALKLTKLCPPTNGVPGGVIGFSVIVTNSGNVPLTNIVLVNNQPAPNTPLATITRLEIGQSITVNGIEPVPTTGCSITDIVSATSRDICNNPVSASATNTCPIACLPKICVTKLVACFLGTNAQGAEVCGNFSHSATGFKVATTTGTNLPAFCYSITVSNCGPIALTDVSVIDDKFGDLTADFPCVSGVFSPGESCEFLFKTSLEFDQTNTVTVTGRSVASGQSVSAVDMATGHVFTASIACAKMVSTNGVDYADSVVIAQDDQNHAVYYKITVFNTSSPGVTLTNLQVTDPLLTGCNIASQIPAALPTGGSFTVACTVSLNCSNINGGQLRNTATVSGEVSGAGQIVCARDINGNPLKPSSSCSALVTCEGCQLIVTKRCAVPAPPPQPFDCSGAKPITSMTVRWNGATTIYVRAWNGSIGTGTPSFFGPVAPGQNVTFTRTTASTPNDIYFELFTDASLSVASKLGNSTFHLSCSDADMNGPEDCGKAAGDGKALSGFINQWVFVGMGGNNRVLDCFPMSVSLESTNTVCNIAPAQNLGCGGALGNDTKPTSLTFRYTGGGCAASSNPQSGKFICSGQIDPTQPVTLATANGYTISPNVVQPGAEFTVSAGSFNAQSGFTLSNNGGTENLSIHTSCSQLLAVGDVFGSLTLVGFNGQQAGADVIYLYTVTNPTPQTVFGIVLTDDKLGPIAGPFDLPAFESSNFQASAAISVTVTNVATASTAGGCDAQSNPVIVHVPEQPPMLPCPTEICADFNDKPIAAGNYVWFNAIVKVDKRGGNPGTATFTGQRIKFISNGVNYDIPAPDAMIIFSPSATMASTVFDTVSNRWVTTVPVKYNGNVFVGGIAVPAPAGGFAKKLKDVCWSGGFESDIGKLEFEWKWAAAVYDQFSTDYNALGVKPIDGDKLNPYKNGDHAGTPENFKKEVVAGARGGGGSNFTGSYSGTRKIVCGTTTPSLECTSGIVAFLVQYTGADIAGPLSVKFAGSQSPSTIIATYLLPGGLTNGTVLSLPLESDPSRPWTIDATKHAQAKLGTKTEVYFNNVLTEIFHTSCSCNQNNFIPGQPACLDASSPDNPTGTKGEPSPLFLVLDFK